MPHEVSAEFMGTFSQARMLSPNPRIKPKIQKDVFSPIWRVLDKYNETEHPPFSDSPEVGKRRQCRVEHTSPWKPPKASLKAVLALERGFLSQARSPSQNAVKYSVKDATTKDSSGSAPREAILAAAKVVAAAGSLRPQTAGSVRAAGSSSPLPMKTPNRLSSPGPAGPSRPGTACSTPPSVIIMKRPGTAASASRPRTALSEAERQVLEDGWNRPAESRPGTALRPSTSATSRPGTAGSLRPSTAAGSPVPEQRPGSAGIARLRSIHKKLQTEFLGFKKSANFQVTSDCGSEVLTISDPDELSGDDDASEELEGLSVIEGLRGDVELSAEPSISSRPTTESGLPGSSGSERPGSARPGTSEIQKAAEGFRTPASASRRPLSAHLDTLERPLTARPRTATRPATAESRAASTRPCTAIADGSKAPVETSRPSAPGSSAGGSTRRSARSTPRSLGNTGNGSTLLHSASVLHDIDEWEEADMPTQLWVLDVSAAEKPTPHLSGPFRCIERPDYSNHPPPITPEAEAALTYTSVTGHDFDGSRFSGANPVVMHRFGHSTELFSQLPSPAAWRRYTVEEHKARVETIKQQEHKAHLATLGASEICEACSTVPTHPHMKMDFGEDGVHSGLARWAAPPVRTAMRLSPLGMMRPHGQRTSAPDPLGVTGGYANGGNAYGGKGTGSPAPSGWTDPSPLAVLVNSAFVGNRPENGRGACQQLQLPELSTPPIIVSPSL